MAEAFGRHGCSVGIHYNRNIGAAEAVADSVTAHGGTAVLISGDVATRTACEAIVAKTVAGLGGIDILINNAGSMVQRAQLAEIDDDIYDAVIDTNIRSVVFVARAALPHLRAAGSACIVNTSSAASRTGGGPGSILYASSKAFVNNLTRGLAKELAPDGVRVNAVAPGVIDTPFHLNRTSPEAFSRMAKSTPLGRIGLAEDCVGAYLFLSSALLSGYVTGQIVDVNGGLVMP